MGHETEQWWLEWLNQVRAAEQLGLEQERQRRVFEQSVKLMKEGGSNTENKPPIKPKEK